MVKILALLLLAAMAVHMIRPLGLPGMTRRADVWKIAVFAFVLFFFVVLAQHAFG